jgi:SAM-dependent methyltransferase
MACDPRDQFEQMLAASIKSPAFIKLTLGKYKGQEEGLVQVFARIVQIKSDLKLSLTNRYQTKEIVKNYGIEAGIELIQKRLGSEFMSGTIFTTQQDIQLEYSKKQQPRLVVSKPSLRIDTLTKTHDHQKIRPIPAENNPYLMALGVTTEQGKVAKNMEDKFRQINKFIEIVGGLVESSELASREQISVLDMGSGKGYLTFALYDFLNNRLGKAATVVGIESRSGLVDFCNSIAQSVGFENLQFEQGTIKDAAASAANITIALHACDTATDDALYRGIQAQSALIILSPCCHKQIRRQMQPESGLQDLLKFGILLERQAEIVTDGLRALLLELSGYEAKVFEFIDAEHTSKNLMIVGVKSSKTVDKERILGQIRDIKQLYGIKLHYLEALLFPELGLSSELKHLNPD